MSALVESLKASELALSDAQAGLLMTSFIVVYMVASPFFGALGDRASRPRLLAAGVALWSAATALGGLAGSFAGLFAARALVGVGEAAYGTIAPTLIADWYPVSRRARAMAAFFCAIPVGSALGYVVGGLLDQSYGWRSAFFAAGAPGLLLALLALGLKDPARGASEPERASAPPGRYRDLLRNRPYILTVAGFAAYTFGLGALAFWMPAFLERVRDMTKAEASVRFGSIVVATGFAGTFLGGWLGDRLLRRTSAAYLWVGGIATLLAAPATAAALLLPTGPAFWIAMVGAQLLLFLSTSPINAAILGSVAPAQRAGAIAACIFAIHAFGDVPSPPLIGWLSDRGGSLEKAMLLIPAAVGVAGLIWIFAAASMEKRAS